MSVRDSRGFSLVELLMVVAIMGVLAAITVPMSGNAIRYIKVSGDARDLANATAVTKMRAAAKFTQARLYLDISGKQYYVQTYNKTTSAWVTEGGTSSLANTVSFSYGPVATPPANTQSPSISQAPLCKNNASPPVDVANTACIVFNSRGIPIDETGSPYGNDAIYVTDGSAVYGITIAATGFIRTWRTNSASTPTWTLQ
jgi:prepilin-type N-terminal cleavage/methylation domain-containing protein